LELTSAELAETRGQLENIQRVLATVLTTRVWQLATLFWRTRQRLRPAFIRRLLALPGRALGGVGPVASETSSQPTPTRAGAAAEKRAAEPPAAFPPKLALANPLPSASAQAVLAGQTPTTLKGYDVICFSVIDWDFRFQRPQQLMTQFAGHGHRVFYVKHSEFLPPGGPERFRARPLGPNLFEIELAAARPRQATIYSQTVDQQDSALREGLEALRRVYGIETALAVVEMPSWGPLALQARERWGWKVVYDCLDEWEDFPLVDRAVAEYE
jgi:hypothetical protein